MRRRRKRPNYLLIVVLLLLIAIMIYVDRMVLPNIPPPFVPTATATRDPESFITEAEGFFNEGKLLQAIESYQQAIYAQPDNPGIYTAMARVQIFAGQYEEALASSEYAILLNPNNSMAHALRGWALSSQEEYIPAEAAIKRALELDPNNAIAHAFYAELLADMYLADVGSYEGVTLAIEESRVATSLAPDALETRRSRGYILEITDNREEAVNEYLAAIEINANIPDLHLSLGRTYRVLGVLDKAITEFEIANTLNPSDPLPELYTSRTYASYGEYAKAAQYAEQAVKDDPTDPYLRGNWGVMLYHSLEWPPAIEQLSLTVNGGLTEEGLTILPLPISSDSRVAEYYFTYGLLLARMNQCNEALPVLQLILATVPTDELAVYNAQEGIRICEDFLLTPSPVSSPAPATVTATPTP